MTLTPSALQQCGNPPCFGLVSEWRGTTALPMGDVYAQPLAVSVSGVTGCSGTCNLIVVADALNNVYGYNGSSTSSAPLWSVNLGAPVNCSSDILFPPCEANVIVDGYVGILGTPVIDMSTKILYAAAAIGLTPTEYDLFAVDITTGAVLGSTSISGSITPGQNPASQNNLNTCVSSFPTNKTLSFDGYAIQRSALLLLNGWVYIAFAPSGSEWDNGWLFGYQFNTSNDTFGSPIVFATTPTGTGGGIWGSGAGPASDGYSIFTVTGNGTWDIVTTDPVSNDFGDSVLRLNPSNLSVLDYYTPSDVTNYQPPNQGNSAAGRCENDEDLGSGGLMILPDNFNGMTVSVNADKESNIYVINLANMGKYVLSGGSNTWGNNVQTASRPGGQENYKNVHYPQSGQGYWSGPAYWRYTNSGTTYYDLYYAATAQNKPRNAGDAPFPIYQYSLGTSGPISSSPGVPTSPSSFCPYSPTPTISSDGSTANTGILWGIEHRNSGTSDPTPNCQGTDLHGALHAFDATHMTELYNSAGSLLYKLAGPTQFDTPTVFQGRVYMGTANLGYNEPGRVYVFGLCNSACIQPSTN